MVHNKGATTKQDEQAPDNLCGPDWRKFLLHIIEHLEPDDEGAERDHEDATDSVENHHQQDVVDEGSRKDQQIVDHRYVVVADQLLDNCGSATAKPWKARAMVHVSA